MNVQINTENINDKLPQGWTNCNLDDLLVAIESGSRPKGGVTGITEGIPSLGGEHLTYKGDFDFSSIRYVPESFANNMRRGIIKKHDILIVKDGATTGKTAFVDDKFPYDYAVINEHIFLCRTSDYVDPRYLFRYLMSKRGQDQILSNFKGSTQGGINLSFAPNTEVILPPLNEQKRIVAKLDRLLTKVNEAKERLDRIPTILKRFRQSVLYSACSGKLTADWREKHPNLEPAEDLLKRIQEERIRRYEEECAKAKAEGKKPPKELAKDQPKKMDDSLLYSIPDTWSWSHFINLGELNRGKSKHRPRNAPQLFGGPYPFIQTGDIARANMIINTHTQTYSEIGLAQSRLFPTNTLCITIAANIADTAILSYPACFPDSVVGFIPEKDFFEGFFALYYMKTIQNHLERFAPATAQKNINIRILNTIPIPVPPLAEQQEIVRRVQALFKKCDIIEERYLKAKAYTDKLTKSILAKAFKGELVPQDPNDEPAELLLERIRSQKVKTEPKRKTKASKSKK